MRERDVENYLVKQAQAIGAMVRKTTWVGLNNCPDRLIMLPNITVWVEVKAPNQKPRAGQQREIERMRQHGQLVHIVDSHQAVNELIHFLRKHL